MQPNNGASKIENVFKNRNFTLVFFGALVSHVSALLYSFAVSFLILKLSGNDSILQGGYLAATGLTFVVASPFCGALADRFNKVRLMYGCDYARGALIILSAILFFLLEGRNTPQIVLLFIVGILGNVIGALFTPSSTSLLPLLLKEEQLQQGNSYMAMLNSFQSILGVLLAGVLYSVLTPFVLFLIVGGGYLLSAISEMFIRYQYVKPETPFSMQAVFADMKSGFVYVKGQRALLALMGAVILINFFGVPVYQNFFPYFAEAELAPTEYLWKEWMKPEMWSAAGTIALSSASIVTALIISTRKDEKGIGRKLKLGFLLYAVGFLSIALTYFFFFHQNGNVNAFLISTLFSMAFIGIWLSFINIRINTSVQKRTDKAMLGKVSSIMSMTSQGLVPVASFLGGIAIHYLGCAALLFLCAGGAALIVVMSLFSKGISSL